MSPYGPDRPSAVHRLGRVEQEYVSSVSLCFTPSSATAQAPLQWRRPLDVFRKRQSWESFVPSDFVNACRQRHKAQGPKSEHHRGFLAHRRKSRNPALHLLASPAVSERVVLGLSTDFPQAMWTCKHRSEGLCPQKHICRCSTQPLPSPETEEESRSMDVWISTKESPSVVLRRSHARDATRLGHCEKSFCSAAQQRAQLSKHDSLGQAADYPFSPGHA